MHALLKEAITTNLGTLCGGALISAFEALGVGDHLQFYDRGIAIPADYIKDIKQFGKELSALSWYVGRTLPMQYVDGLILIDTLATNFTPPIIYQTLPSPLKNSTQYLNIQYNMLKPGGDYHKVTLPFFRERAAKRIQVEYRLHALEQRMKREPQLEQRELLSTEHQGLLEKKEGLRQTKLKEPLDTGFNQDIATKIKNHRYDQINYEHPDFTRRLFGALRAGVITMNEMMTAKLMYDSLFCFNKGKMPENTAQQFSKFKLNDANGPYNYHSISYWGEEEDQKLLAQLQDQELQEKNHYYTINLPHHQTVAYIYYTLRGMIERKKGNAALLIPVLAAYIKTKHSGQPIPTLPEELNTIDKLKKIQTFILQEEPSFSDFLNHQYSVSNPKKTLGLSYEDYAKEMGNIEFFIALATTQCQIPTLCLSPQYNAKKLGTPILSFVLPTIDTLNTLQSIAHGKEFTLPVAVLGLESTKMIRAYDELPAELSKINPQLSETLRTLITLYPTAEGLDTPSRPIEITHPDIEKSPKPHDFICYDFLLSWHDLFHAWRCGSNYKEVIRKLRRVHDEKAGLAVESHVMAKNIWKLTDVDLSAGRDLRNNRDGAHLTSLKAFLLVLKDAGFDFLTAQDDNHLLVYELCRLPNEWGPLFFGLHLDEHDLQFLQSQPLLVDKAKLFETFLIERNKMQLYLQAHPHASLVEIILNDLLEPIQEADALFLSLLTEADYKNLFYWSRNSGLYFKKEFDPLLVSLGGCRQLRSNAPEIIRAALINIVLSEAAEKEKKIDRLIPFLLMDDPTPEASEDDMDSDPDEPDMGGVCQLM